jgi:hypothetical protein
MMVVIYEPELFKKSISMSAYQPLLESFLLVLQSGLSVVCATISFSNVLEDMAHRDQMRHKGLYWKVYIYICIYI